MSAQEIYDHRFDTKELFLKYHPDKGGTNEQFTNLRVNLEYLKTMEPNWINLAKNSSLKCRVSTKRIL